MKEFTVKIFAADHEFYVGPCESIVIPTSDGQYGILAGHCSAVMAMVPGTMTFRAPGGDKREAVVSGGIVRISGEDVLILADSVERPEDIDMVRAQRAADRAKEEMLQKKSIREYKEAQIRLGRAMNRLKAGGRKTL